MAFGSGSSEAGGFNFLATVAKPLGDGMPYVQATIAALDEVTDVRSLAAPSLLVRNNATATITVGTQVPVQSSQISTGGIGNVVSSAQYVSTGITLTVTPRINPGGLVYMDILQDVSRPGARDPDISTSGNPPINNKSVTSQVAVQSGQTVFLGGLDIRAGFGPAGPACRFSAGCRSSVSLFGSKSKANIPQRDPGHDYTDGC